MKKIFLFLLPLVMVILLTGFFMANRPGKIQTVNGPVEAKKLGFALTHEHLMSNFGKPPEEASVYDEKKLYQQVIPYLRHIKSKGVSSVFDCTTAYFGRRVDILKNLADSTGLTIVTNTGFYGAANDRYVPKFARNATAEEISAIWIEEYREGIEGSGIRPGFVKLAFDDGIPSEIDKKLFTAGILTHLNTGLSLAVHTGNNPPAIQTQLQYLYQYQVSPEALILVHANAVENIDILFRAAAEGAWISLDGAKATNTDEYVEKLRQFRSRNLLHKVLLSHDGDAFTMDGSMREFHALMENLIPALIDEGFSNKEIQRITVLNPAEAFQIRVRRG